MRRSGKRPLTECLSENNGPPNSKRSRTEVTPVPAPASRGNGQSRRRRRRGRQSVQNQSQFEQSSIETRSLESQGRKRHTSSFNSDLETDENEIAELSKRLKLARLRPVFFTISSFIEQTVSDISVTVGEDDGDAANTTSSFTFVLPLPTPRPFGNEHCDGINSNNAFTLATET